MAEVWMGRRQGVGGATKSVAVKFIIPSKTNSERHREMFLSEARLSMMLSHSNVIQVFDAGEDQGRLYMVMEWIDGMNLSQFLAHLRHEGHRPSLSVAGYVIGEVLKGLAYAHNLYHEGRQITIVHRDISPQNVLVSVSGEVKILDFGVARLAQEETSGVHIKGKLRYMAPEHLGGSSKAPTVDVYGAGAILHELVEGAKYRDGADEVQLYNQILGGHTPDLTREDTPAELAALRSAMLHPDENARVASADLALEMLEHWPGYRSAAGELSRLVRGYMGVNTPRSGIHMKAHGAPRARPTVDAMADTSPPTAATATQQGGRTGATSPEISASMPGAGTDPSVAPLGQSLVMRKAGPSPLLLGLGAGVLVAIGAVGVVVATRGDATSTELAQAKEAGIAPGDVGDDEVEAPSEPSEEDGGDGSALEIGAPQLEAEAEPAAGVEPEADEEPEAGVEPEADEEPEAGGEPDEDETSPEPRTSRRSRRRRAAAQSPTAKKPEPPTAKVKISLKLKKPLTVAYVKIDGGAELVLEPMKRIELPLGKHSIMWRPNQNRPFVQGRAFTLTEGGGRTVRVTQHGVRLE